MSAPGIDTLRIPPHSVESEQSLLAGLMNAPKNLAQVADWLGEDDFYLKHHRLMYRAISELANRNAAIDPVTLTDWFEDNALADSLPSLAYPVEVSMGPGSSANVVAYAEIVANRSKLRQAIDAGMRLTESAWKPGANPADVIGTAVHGLSNLAAERRGGLEPVKPALRRLFAQMLERYQHPADNRLLGLPTPWKELNDLTHGLRDGNLYILGGRPSMGKSILAGQIAAFTAIRESRTAWFSVEMTAEECLSRAMSAISGIDYSWIEQPDAQDPEQDEKWAAIQTANAALLKAPLHIDDTPSLTIDQLKARARRAHQQEPLRLIVIDHAHDMKINPQHARFEYGAIAQGAKDLAKEFRCPVILLAQLNRNVTHQADKRPKLTDLRESGEFEQKGDVILFVHRDDYYNPTNRPGVVELIPAKGRNLKITFPIVLKNDYGKMRALDWEGPIPERASTPDASSGLDARGRS